MLFEILAERPQQAEIRGDVHRLRLPPQAVFGRSGRREEQLSGFSLRTSGFSVNPKECWVFILSSAHVSREFSDGLWFWTDWQSRLKPHRLDWKLHQLQCQILERAEE